MWQELLKTIFDEPLANIFIVAGIAFLGIAVVGNISGKIQPGTGGRILSGLVGMALMGLGLVMYQPSTPSTPSTPTDVPVSNPTATANDPVVLNPTLTPDIVPVTDPPISVPPTLTLVPPLPDEEYVDTGTQEQGMHACPV